MSGGVYVSVGRWVSVCLGGWVGEWVWVSVYVSVSRWVSV